VTLAVVAMMLLKIQVFWDITLSLGEQMLMFQRFIGTPLSGSKSPNTEHIPEDLNLQV